MEFMQGAMLDGGGLWASLRHEQRRPYLDQFADILSAIGEHRFKQIGRFNSDMSITPFEPVAGDGALKCVACVRVCVVCCVLCVVCCVRVCCR
jgi:hypothetical protein